MVHWDYSAVGSPIAEVSDGGLFAVVNSTTAVAPDASTPISTLTVSTAEPSASLTVTMLRVNPVTVTTGRIACTVRVNGRARTPVH